MAVPGPQPGDKGGTQRADRRSADDVDRLDLEQQGAHQQRGLHPFARDHQQREREHAEERGGAALECGSAKVPFNVALDPPGRSPHMDGE